MAKKKVTASSDNVFDIIANVSLTVKDPDVDDPCRLELKTKSYLVDFEKGIVIPDRFRVEISGECKRSKAPYVEILEKLAKFIKLNAKSKNSQRLRRNTITLMVEAQKLNSEHIKIRFKPIPVKGNKADYEKIYSSFGLDETTSKG